MARLIIRYAFSPYAAHYLLFRYDAMPPYATPADAAYVSPYAPCHAVSACRYVTPYMPYYAIAPLLRLLPPCHAAIFDDAATCRLPLLLTLRYAATARCFCRRHDVTLSCGCLILLMHISLRRFSAASSSPLLCRHVITYVMLSVASITCYAAAFDFRYFSPLIHTSANAYVTRPTSYAMPC